MTLIDLSKKREKSIGNFLALCRKKVKEVKVYMSANRKEEVGKNIAKEKSKIQKKIGLKFEVKIAII